MAYHIEQLNAEIDLVEQDDGSWRADKYPKSGSMFLTSARDDYSSRPELLRALHSDPDFWVEK